MDVVESVLDRLFLKFNSSLLDLYEFLDVKEVSPVEAYIDFVFRISVKKEHWLILDMFANLIIQEVQNRKKKEKSRSKSC